MTAYVSAHCFMSLSEGIPRAVPLPPAEQLWEKQNGPDLGLHLGNGRAQLFQSDGFEQNGARNQPPGLWQCLPPSRNRSSQCPAGSKLVAQLFHELQPALVWETDITDNQVKFVFGGQIQGFLGGRSRQYLVLPLSQQKIPSWSRVSRHDLPPVSDKSALPEPRSSATAGRGKRFVSVGRRFSEARIGISSVNSAPLPGPSLAGMRGPSPRGPRQSNGLWPTQDLIPRTGA